MTVVSGKEEEEEEGVVPQAGSGIKRLLFKFEEIRIENALFEGYMTHLGKGIR